MRNSGIMKKKVNLPKWMKCTIAVVMCAMISCGVLFFNNSVIKQIKRDEIGANIEHLDEVGHQTTVPEGYVGIYTKEDLMKIATDTLSALNSNKYILMSDIDMSGENWTPIGGYTHSFIGIFDGNNYTVSNINSIISNETIAMFGMFGHTYEAIIKNLTLENLTIETTMAKTSHYGRISCMGG